MSSITILIAISTLLTQILSAGIVIHTHLIAQTHHLLPSSIQSPEYIPYLLTGAFFPDAFYTCGSPEGSEFTHWPPFLRIAVDYYRNLTKDSENEEALRLKAFLYGAYTHQVSDSMWHSLGLDEGLLKTIAMLEFEGDIDKAHRYIDVAGDFIALGDIAGFKDDSKILDFFIDNWDYPDLDFVLEILKLSGFDMNYYNVFYCLERGKLALRSEVSLFREFELLYQIKSPWFGDQLKSYYEGGVDDLVYSVGRCMGNLNDWFEHGVGDGDLCGAIVKDHHVVAPMETQDVRMSITKSNDNSFYVSSLIPNSQFGSLLQIGPFGLMGEIVLAVSAIQEDNYKGSVYLLPLIDILPSLLIQSQISLRPSSQGIIKLQSHKDYHHAAKFGSRLFQCKIQSLPLLFILSSSPQSTIQIFHQSQPVLTITTRDNTQFGRSGKLQQYQSFTSFDLNDHGYGDILIGSPYDSFRERGLEGTVRQRGEAVLVSSEKLLYYVLNDQVKEIDIEELIDFKISLPPELQVKKHGDYEGGYEHFGSQVSVIDNGLILIGAESLGLISVHDADGTFHGVITHELVYVDRKNIKNSKIVSSATSNRFGANYIKSYKYANETFIAVNRHASSQTLSKVSGSVVIFKVNKGKHDLNVWHYKTIQLEDTPENNLAKFGHTLEIINDDNNKDNLLISSTRCVYRISLSTIHRSGGSTFILTSPPLTCDEVGKSGYAESIAHYYEEDDGKEFVFVGESGFGKRVLIKDQAKLMGRVKMLRI